MRDTSPLQGKVEVGWLLQKIDGFDVSTLSGDAIVKMLVMRAAFDRRLSFRRQGAATDARVVVNIALEGGQQMIRVPAKSGVFAKFDPKKNPTLCARAGAAAVRRCPFTGQLSLK